ncbi:MAG: hypothetical protein QME28_07885, partial [Candidatus Saccharicenans sp.]|nr:hypothetical protein [Candidatus Saccharicenans sp.]
AVRERCDGWRRNPWNEVECGHHYARAMSSWGLLLALSGFNYSAPEGRLGFAPFFNQEDFRTFWSPGSAWGTYEQHPEGDKVFSVRLNLEHGDCHPRELNLELPRGFSSEVRSISCTPGGKNLRVQVMRSRKKVTLKFRQPVPLKAGESLTLRIFS